jgi:hypothetical protein
MSLSFKSMLFAGAMLMAGAAHAQCTYLGASPMSSSTTQTTITVTQSFTYICGDGYLYTVTTTETWSTTGGDGEPGFWQQTVSGPCGSTPAWGTGLAPIFRGNIPDFDPRSWQFRQEGWAEADPQY